MHQVLQILPHLAVAAGKRDQFQRTFAQQFLTGNLRAIVFLETAHPAKFGETIKQSLGVEVPVPPSLEEALRKEKHSIVINNDLDGLKDFLLKNNR